MIEIILPTMWMGEQLPGMLAKYDANEYVHKIHLIDNGMQYAERYPKKKGLGLKKVRPYRPTTLNEWYVNPAWNLGATMAGTDAMLCIANDDIEFDTRIFEWVLNNADGFDILGLAEDSFVHKNPDVTYSPSITRAPHHTYGFGCLMFIKKQKYRPIPHQFKVFYGDTYLLEKIGLTGFVLHGLPISGNMHATSTAVPGTMQLNQEEILHWSKLP